MVNSADASAIGLGLCSEICGNYGRSSLQWLKGMGFDEKGKKNRVVGVTRA